MTSTSLAVIWNLKCPWHWHYDCGDMYVITTINQDQCLPTSNLVWWCLSGASSLSLPSNQTIFCKLLSGKWQPRQNVITTFSSTRWEITVYKTYLEIGKRREEETDNDWVKSVSRVWVWLKLVSSSGRGEVTNFIRFIFNWDSTSGPLNILTWIHCCHLLDHRFVPEYLGLPCECHLVLKSSISWLIVLNFKMQFPILVLSDKVMLMPGILLMMLVTLLTMLPRTGLQYH